MPGAKKGFFFLTPFIGLSKSMIGRTMRFDLEEIPIAGITAYEGKRAGSIDRTLTSLENFSNPIW
jgi:hypothetical protein